jgi:glyoxylase-like metal-dependent hydrolase (beta-lactamase superfamily II)
MTSRGGIIVKAGEKMGVKQMFDDDSSTYTYMLWDQATKDAILIDPVDLQVDRDLAAAEELGLNLVYGVNTHAHADHITGTFLLKQKVDGLKSVISEASRAAADVQVNPGDRIMFGSRYVEVRATPGEFPRELSLLTCYFNSQKTHISLYIYYTFQVIRRDVSVLWRMINPLL